MDEQPVIFQDLGVLNYQEAWDYQEGLLRKNVAAKSAAYAGEQLAGVEDSSETPGIRHYLLFVEHPPVYTLGKSGNMRNVLLSEDRLREKGIGFHRTNRGGDITFHGPGQIVGYPILDLEKFDTDIGHYLRRLEETIIRSLAYYNIPAGRSTGETGVWLDPSVPGRERKICAIGVRCSRWITMHGFAFNVNTDLAYFNHIIPCGIQNKQVTSLERELGRPVDLDEAKAVVKKNFSEVFGVKLSA
jgi:lipoyl(octanoyl) transferase